MFERGRRVGMVQVPHTLRRIGLAEEIPSKAGASCWFFFVRLVGIQVNGEGPTLP